MKKSNRPSELRSKIMRSVKSKNTGAELSIRRRILDLGYHYYRLHVKTLPGSPDIVFKRFKKVIFVNGCFWHGHECSKGRLPKTNVKFWKDKVQRNMERDMNSYKLIKKMGWRYLVIWQCEIKNERKLIKKIEKFFSY